MAKIKVTSKCELYDGMSITFNAPCDCTAVDGLKVYYENTSQSFSFRDAHGNDLTGYSGLFSEGSYVKVVLDTRRGYAFLQNADTNSYLEERFNKVISEDTKALYGLEPQDSLDDVFEAIAYTQGIYGFSVSVKLADGTPVPHVQLNGLMTPTRDGIAETDKDGRCKLALSETSSPTVSISNYLGILNKTQTLAGLPGAFITPIEIIVEENPADIIEVSASGTYRMWSYRPVDFCLVGGGASGACGSGGDSDSGYNYHYGQGGGGGYVENLFDLEFSKDDCTIDVTIGAGGKFGSYNGVNSPGGSTSLQYKGTEAVALGSPGREGNGVGGSTTAGTDGSTHLFDDPAMLIAGGGGGGVPRKYSSNTSADRLLGGKDCGGHGAVRAYSSVYATAGLAPGGGGGGGWCMYNTNRKLVETNFHPTAGGDGRLYVRYKEVGA